MKKEQVLLGLGLATAMATGFTNHVKADESINEKSSKVNATQVETKKAEVRWNAYATTFYRTSVSSL